MMNFIAAKMTSAGRDLMGVLLPWLLVGALSVAGSGFLVAAAWMLIAENLGLVAAHSIIGALLILPMVVWGISRTARRRADVRLKFEADVARTRAETAEVAFSLSAALGERIARQQKNHR